MIFPLHRQVTTDNVMCIAHNKLTVLHLQCLAVLTSVGVLLHGRLRNYERRDMPAAMS